MRKSNIIFLLSAALLLASCGGQASSSSSSSASSSASSSSSSSASVSSESSSESSSIPFTPSEEDYGILFGSFNGKGGVLKIAVDKATVTAIDGNVTEFKPTSITTIETSAGETLPVVNYGEDYRIRLSSEVYKFVILQQKNGSKWETIGSYMPDASGFAGAYNGIEYGDVNANNILRIFGNEYDYERGGYPIRYAMRQNTAIQDGAGLLHSFFMVEDGEYVVAADELDLTDGLYYESPFTLSETGLRSVGYETDYWFPDFSMFIGSGTDSNGNLYSMYYDADSGFTEYNSYVDYGMPTLAHDEEGFYFTFGDDAAYTLRINANEFSLTSGETKANYAPLWTFYDQLDYTARSFAGDDFAVSFYVDMDWDTYLPYLTVSVNGESVESPSFSATEDGIAYVNFTYGGTEYSAFRSSEYVLSLVANATVQTLYDVEYLDNVYVQSYVNFNAGVIQNVVIDEDHKLTVNDQLIGQGKYVYSEDYGQVVLSFTNFLIVAVDEKAGLYYFNQGTSGFFLLTKTVYEGSIGTYKGLVVDGSNEVLDFAEDGTLTYRGAAAANLTLTVLQDSYGGLNPGYLFSVGEATYVYLPDFAGAASVYSASNDGFALIESALIEDEYDGLTATKFLYASEEYGVEEFYIDPATGKVMLTTPNAEGGASVVAYDDFYYSHGEYGEAIVNVLVTVSGQSVYAPFAFDGKVVTIGNVTYLPAAYFYGQGVWYNDSGVLVVDGTTVTWNGTTTSTTGRQGENEGEYQIVSEDDVYTFTVGSDGTITGKTSSGGLTYYAFNAEEWIGTYECADAALELKINENTGKLTAYKDGAFFMDSYTFVIVDGAVCLKFSTPFGDATFSIAGGKKTATYTAKEISF